MIDQDGIGLSLQNSYDWILPYPPGKIKVSLPPNPLRRFSYTLDASLIAKVIKWRIPSQT